MDIPKYMHIWNTFISVGVFKCLQTNGCHQVNESFCEPKLRLSIQYLVNYFLPPSDSCLVLTKH